MTIPLRLGVNIDHVATLRNARGGWRPDPIRAAHAAVLAGADGLVHCTPVGMAEHPGLPLDAALLRPELWVADIVYRPLDTELLITARERAAIEYRQGLKTRWKADAEVNKIARLVFLLLVGVFVPLIELR